HTREAAAGRRGGARAVFAAAGGPRRGGGAAGAPAAAQPVGGDAVAAADGPLVGDHGVAGGVHRHARLELEVGIGSDGDVAPDEVRGAAVLARGDVPRYAGGLLPRC